jgi:hypothetical protein
MRQTVDRALYGIVYAGVRLTVRFQSTAFSLLALAFGIKRLGRAYQTLMQSQVVGQMAAAAGCPEVPGRMVAVVESRLNPSAPRTINARPITAASVASMPILFEAGPYKLIGQTPPNESCPYWIYDFIGPGFERTSMGGGFAFIGCTESCGESHMGALARAFAAGHASATARVEDSCQTR